jgi:hypothetical protein
MNRSRTEATVQVLILLAIGGCAAAASFTHVHNVAQAHGQPGWLAWADAVVLELMSIATGLEIRRRHRANQPAGFVVGVLVAAVALSLSAQVVEAEASVIGWLAAALPALGFLACVKLVLTRTATPRQAVSVPMAAEPVARQPIETFRPPTAPDHTPPQARPTRPPVSLVPIPADAFTRSNGHQPVGGAR